MAASAEVAGTSQILCPTCRQPARVVTGSMGHRMANGELPRVRECTGPGHHQFKTFERARRMRIEDVGIRESAGQKLSRFDRDRLSADLQRYLGPVLSRSEVKGVLRASVDIIDNRLDQIIQPVTKPDEREQFQHFIYDQEVRAAVGNTLRTFGDHGTEEARRYRIAHILYALATYGAIQYQRSDGWNTALEVIDFIQSNYSFDNNFTQSKVQRGRPEQSWWEPMPIPTVPKTVVKKQRVPRNQEYPLREQPFDRNRFERSVRKVFAGRPDPDRLTSLTTKWTLWALLGQSTVTSSQISMTVADCLRRLDDVAYLRWTTVAKNLGVTRIREEAIGLVVYPSPRLTFTEIAAPNISPPIAPITSLDKQRSSSDPADQTQIDRPRDTHL